MKTQFETELHALASRDVLFLNFANQLLSNYSALSGASFPEFKSNDHFFEYKYRGAGRGSAIVALIDKVHHIVIQKGSPVSVVPMLKRIVLKGKKKQSRPDHGEYGNALFLGYAHFRWDETTYDLNENELKAIKLYLNIPLVALSEIVGFEESIGFEKLRVSSVLVASGVVAPWAGKKENSLHNHFSVQVINTVHSLAVKFDFYGSAYDFKKGVIKLSDNSLLSALQCFLSDCECGLKSFEEFCDDFGYDSDSISSFKIYEACKKSYEKYTLLGLSDNHLYDLLNELSEAGV